jgi:murein DD-endopeptidase MepM/ murein hydrolase activator NlpD
VTKKPFGIKVSPSHSPVSPERFSGYHTGVDFEILAGEENSDVPVSAICDGRVLVARRVSGYGGVLVQSCTIDNRAVTVLYGHLKLSRIKLKSGDTIKTAEHIGILGAAYSYDTDGERKHLHLGIRKDDKIVYLGYAQKESDLSAWLDFMKSYE